MLVEIQKNTNIDVDVYGYTHLDFSGDQDEKKSIAGYIFMIERTSISWSSRKQSFIALLS